MKRRRELTAPARAVDYWGGNDIECD